MNSINSTLKNADVLSVIAVFVLWLTVPAANAKEVIGWVENALILPHNIAIKAKIDTGAQSSSLHCDCQDRFTRDGEQWIRFSLKDSEGEYYTLEKKVVRTVKIKRHFGGMQERDVVRLGICISGHYEETDVSIVDRSGFNYDLLVGRSYLEDDFIVDPSVTFTVNPQCMPQSGDHE